MARELTLQDPHGILEPLKTPCLVVPTEMGIIRHVTPDNSADFPLWFSAADFVGNEMDKTTPIPIQLGFGQKWTFLGVSADFNNFDEGPAKHGVRVFQRNGACPVITPADYDALVAQFNPRAVVSLFSQILPDSSSRQEKLRIEAAETYAKSYENKLNFVSGFSKKSNEGLFMQYGSFTEDDAKKALEIISSRPSTVPRMIFFDGHPCDVRRAVDAGFDLFVLRLPVIWAEKGIAMCFGFDPDDTFEDLCMDLKDMDYARDHRPLVEGCDCLCCRNHTRSYVHHLLEVHEILAGTLLVLHNLRHYQRFFAAIRNEIKKTYN